MAGVLAGERTRLPHNAAGIWKRSKFFSHYLQLQQVINRLTFLKLEPKTQLHCRKGKGVLIIVQTPKVTDSIVALSPVLITVKIHPGNTAQSNQAGRLT